jgi:dihydrofolate reductase
MKEGPWARSSRSSRSRLTASAPVRNVGPGNGLGDSGELLHEWMFSDARGAEIREEILRTAGAFVVGRRMFDLGVDPWGEEPPFDASVFVVTHRATPSLTKRGGTTYIFVTDGIASALARAKKAAGDRDVAILGGADVIRQFLSAGLVDELRVHVVPVFLVSGTRLFDGLRNWDLGLEPATAEVSAGVTHLIYRAGTRSR